MVTSNSTSNWSSRRRVLPPRLWEAVGLAALGAIALAMIAGRRETVLASGAFHSVSRSGSGSVAVVSGNGTQGRLLRVTALHIDEPANAEVRLIAATDAFDDNTAEVTAFVTVGDLPAGAATAAYPIDSSVDLQKFRAVTLWWPAKRLNMMTAPLRPKPSVSQGVN